jgi:hypothetical protein
MRNTANRVAGEAISLSLPTEEPDIKRYIASGAIPGVGGILSGRLVRQFGAGVFRVAEDEPEQWATVKGPSRDRDSDAPVTVILGNAVEGRARPRVALDAVEMPAARRVTGVLRFKRSSQLQRRVSSPRSRCG